jgi:hypothetical protein
MDRWADLRETSRAAGTTNQLCARLRAQPRPLRSLVGDLVPYSPRSA